MPVATSEKGYVNGTAWWPEIQKETTPELVWPASLDVYDRMRRSDSQVISVLRAVTFPVRRTTWRIEPGAASEEVTRFVAEELGLNVAGEPDTAPRRTRDRFSWAEHLRLALTMLPFGHSFFEQTYRWDPTVGRFHLRKLGWRPPRTISAVDVEPDGGLKSIRQYGISTTGVSTSGDVVIPVGRLVAYVNDREGGNWLGQSLLRPAYGPWLLKNPALRTWAITNQRNGTGVPIYKGAPVPESLTDPDEIKAWQVEEQKAGQALATSYTGGVNAGGTVPHGADLELKGVTGRLPESDPLVRYCDEQIGRAVLANFLSLGGDNSTGSYALGDTFANFFVQSLQTVAMQVADVSTQHIVEDLVDVNFGTGVPSPRVTFDEIGSAHAIDGNTVQALVHAGVLSPDEPLEQHLRTIYRLPAADVATRRAAAGTQGA